MYLCRYWLGLLVLVVLNACSGSQGDDNDETIAGADNPPVYTLARVFAQSRFATITDVQADPGETPYLYIVQKPGTIRRLDPDTPAGQSRLFVDIAGTPNFNTAGEGGLLGLAFDPGFAANGYFYVHYTRADPRRIIISRFRFDGSLPVDPATEQVVLSVAHPGRDNHYGGALAFGPVDGLLYLTMGDGGGSFDPDDNAQDRGSMLGKILRIDISTTGQGGTPNYSIPSANPFAGNTRGFAEEIFAYGFRNPYRLSTDQPSASTQRIWVGDVGQNAREEVDIVKQGGNYGWDCREGTRMVDDDEGASPACDGLDDTRFTPPVTEYRHDLGDSITGGYVYRGDRLPGLAGRYIYADFGSGRIFAYDPDTGGMQQLSDTDLRITSFGRGASGDLYIATLDGRIYQLETE